MTHSIKISILAVLLFYAPHSPARAFAETETRSADSALVLDFADWLYAEGDIAEAEHEYLRYLFLTDTADFKAVSTLANIYRSSGNNEKLLSHSDRYLHAMTAPREIQYMAFMKGYSLFRLKQWPQLDETLAMVTTTATEIDSGAAGYNQPFAALTLALNIYRGNFKAAKTTISLLENDDTVASLKAELERYTPKRRTVAVGLSAIVPGLGKLYAGQYGDALFSFITTGVLAGLTAYSFQTDGTTSWKPWVYGVSCGIFYSANLYGSSQAALRYNNTHESRLREKADTILERYPR